MNHTRYFQATWSNKLKINTAGISILLLSGFVYNLWHSINDLAEISLLGTVLSLFLAA